jgi:UDP-GlcNAc:undecaprenyl-phosphate GlcNAc-1-phosphate transferase
MDECIAMVDPEPISLTELAEFTMLALAQRSWQIAAVISGTLVALAVLNVIAPRLDLIDHPDRERKGHRHPVALTGGLAILCGVWIGTLVQAGTGASAILALLGIVVVVHAFDDQSGLSAPQRLVIDSVIALAFIVITGNLIETLGTVGDSEVRLGVLAAPFTILLYVAVSNAYNMVDGFDGLALSQFLIALLGIGIFHLVFARASGFAPHAFPVAIACVVILLANLGMLGRFFRCFLGDSGARFLGFFLVYVLVMEGYSILSPVEAVYFIALPLLDMCAVIAVRLRLGHGPMRADRRHLHHLLVDAGVAPIHAVMIIGSLSLALIGLFIIQHALGFGDLVLGIVFIGVSILYWQARRYLVRALGRGRTTPPEIEPAR